ncbi:NUDIX hydrolase [Streptomyces polyrhachis]|uniref:NUDIX hydrolase n=1 Tax=Streptomyces polyrhachis TaxID=1282885 RepID=A0ABW2GJL0_9ACTN
MPEPRLRHAARAVVLDEADRVLLCRFALPGRNVWATPGGGVEAGESPTQALRRELREEIGLPLADTPPRVWHRRVLAAGHARGYDGIVEDYYLVRTPPFDPAGALTPQELAAENIAEFRWWTIPDIAAYEGPDLFAPRGLPALLTALLKDGVPLEPVELGL